MSPVSLGLDLLLTALLLAALAVGVRLNARLKTLRESQGEFVKAVSELDAAAARAEAGLSALRTATQDTHDALLTRIETARALSARLDRASEDAASASARLEHAARRAEQVAAPRPAPEPLRLVEPVAAGAAVAAAPLDLSDPFPPRARGPAAPAEPGPADRLAAFVARRRGARA